MTRERAENGAERAAGASIDAGGRVGGVEKSGAQIGCESVAEVRAPCLICDAESDDRVFCQPCATRVGHLVARIPMLHVILPAIEAANGDDELAINLLRAFLPPTTLTRDDAAALTGKPLAKQAAYLAQTYGLQSLPLTMRLWDQGRGGWMVA